jgi:hypothetical protein
MVLAAAFAASVSRPGRADAPAGRYTVSGGIVVDTKTGLSWQQAASSTAMYEADAVSYCTALAAAGGGWRLPSVSELESIIDETRYDPAIDVTAFPNTPAMGFFWTQSAYVDFPDYNWTVSFLYGISTVYYNPQQQGWVRCVKP